MKEGLMSGSGILWAYFGLIYERNPRVFSKSGSKVYWWVFLDQTLNLPTGYCERASCYTRANLPRTVPKSYWSWPVAICEGSVPTCTVVSPNTSGVHVPWRLYACLVMTKVPD